jgi:outer membrane protein assembly factor BamB
MRNANRMVGVMAGFGLLLGAGGAGAQDWPQWRGPGRDNKVTGFSAPATWPKELTQKWKVPVGLGESSPTLVGDKLYVFGRQGDDEVIQCLDAASGKEIWKDKYAAAAVKGPASGHPGPRSTPAVGEGKVCTLGVDGTVSCLDAASGKVVWRKETKAKPAFYTSTSPIIADGKCVVYLDTLTAFDLANGESKWGWKGGGTPYGSPVLMTVDGVKQVATPAVGSLAGVGLADGKLLWEYPLGRNDYPSTYSTPVVDGPMVIYSAAPGKGKGGGLEGMVALKIEKKDGTFTPTEVWKKPLAAHGYHTPVLHDGLLFGVTTSLNPFCVDAKTGETLWVDKADKRGQCGATLNAGNILLSLSSDKELVAFEPSGKGYMERAKYTVATTEPWAVPIVAGNRVFVKDRDSLALWTIE